MLIATTLRSTFIKLPPKTVKYRSYKNFNETVFLHELDQKLIQGDLYRSDDPYFSFYESLSKIIMLANLLCQMKVLFQMKI